jgi:hypothetical protein
MPYSDLVSVYPSSSFPSAVHLPFSAFSPTSVSLPTTLASSFVCSSSLTSNNKENSISNINFSKNNNNMISYVTSFSYDARSPYTPISSPLLVSSSPSSRQPTTLFGLPGSCWCSVCGSQVPFCLGCGVISKWFSIYGFGVQAPIWWWFSAR